MRPREGWLSGLKRTLGKRVHSNVSGVRIPLFPCIEWTVTFESGSLAKLHDITPHEPYAVAVSGGVDSMTLMLLIARLNGQNHPGKPTILTVNHGFRTEAERETDFVKTQAQNLGLECCILNCTNSVTNKSQVTARKIRYDLITAWCLTNNVQFVLTAHTKNDQAETVLLRLERGSGVDGLAGMHERAPLNKIVILRPLLSFTREEIHRYACEKQLSWIEDPSNSDPRYKRTFYRRFISEHSESMTLVNRLYITAQHMQKALSCLMHYVKEAVDTCLEFHDLGYTVIRTAALRSVPEEIARRLLLLLLMTMGHKDLKLRYAKFALAFGKIWAGENFKPFTISGCQIIHMADGTVIVAREVARILPITPIDKGTTLTRWDNRFELSLHYISKDGILRVMRMLSSHKPEKVGIEATDYYAANLEQELWIAPLGIAPIPDYLRHINRNVVKGLPVLVCRGKVIAYPLQKGGIHGIPSIKLERVLLREGLISLVHNQL